VSLRLWPNSFSLSVLSREVAGAIQQSAAGEFKRKGAGRTSGFLRKTQIRAAQRGLGLTARRSWKLWQTFVPFLTWVWCGHEFWFACDRISRNWVLGVLRGFPPSSDPPTSIGPSQETDQRNLVGFLATLEMPQIAQKNRSAEKASSPIAEPRH